MLAHPTVGEEIPAVATEVGRKGPPTSAITQGIVTVGSSDLRSAGAVFGGRDIGTGSGAGSGIGGFDLLGASGDDFLPDAGFEFDVDGNLIDLSYEGEGNLGGGGGARAGEGGTRGVAGESDAALRERVRLEHEEGRRVAGMVSLRSRFLCSAKLLNNFSLVCTGKQTPSS